MVTLESTQVNIVGRKRQPRLPHDTTVPSGNVSTFLIPSHVTKKLDLVFSMPLVVFSGQPASGKSTIARQLQKCLEERGQQTVLINDETLGISKEAYAERESEKSARAQQISAVKRYLSPEAVVILDAMNYIKGFRYQLYCEARALPTTHCVVYVGAGEVQCVKNNSKSPNPWPENLRKALSFRFEEPNGMTRWDSPLFIVTPEDQLPFDDIWKTLIERKPVQPKASTVTAHQSTADYVTVLNDKTSEVVKELFALFKDAAGASVRLHGRQITLPYRLTMPQLLAIRRNFVATNKSSELPADHIKGLFTEFAEDKWDLP